MRVSDIVIVNAFWPLILRDCAEILISFTPYYCGKEKKSTKPHRPFSTALFLSNMHFPRTALQERKLAR